MPDLARGKVPEDRWFFPVVARLHAERTGYPTQKPEALLERILLASSRPGDLVLDVFCGSGTSPAVAARLGRRWLACDSSPVAVATTYRRLLLQHPTPPFSVWHAGAPTPFASIQARWLGSRRGGQICLDGLRAPGEPRQDPQACLAYWEIDWKSDGRTFRSLSQVVRPWRQAKIPTEATSPEGVTVGPWIGLRATDFDGRVYLGRLSGK